MVIRLRGFADHRRFQVDADLVSRTDAELVVATHDGHTAILRPRYADVLRPPYKHGYEICNFLWDGEFIGAAQLHEHEGGDITIVPEDFTYADDFVYAPPCP
jgi:hypothetical protein